MSEDVTREVDQLLKDREKYQSWLDRLTTSTNATASQQAFERVRQDYQQRLDEVVVKLRAHSDALKAKLKEAEREVADLDKERGNRSEKLDEARLRHSVGEYSDGDEWKDLEGRLLGALQESEKDLEKARADIARLEQILASVQGADAKPKAEAAPKAAATPQAKPRAAAEATTPIAPPTPPPPAKRPAAQKPVEPQAAEAPTGPAPDDDGYLSLEELVLEDKSPEEAVIKPNASAQQAGTDQESAAPGEGAAVGDELAFLESLSLSGGDESESFSFLERHGSGTPQTIICPHCSAANDPAEWYCTECGEELPAE